MHTETVKIADIQIISPCMSEDGKRKLKKMLAGVKSEATKVVLCPEDGWMVTVKGGRKVKEFKSRGDATVDAVVLSDNELVYVLDDKVALRKEMLARRSA